MILVWRPDVEAVAKAGSREALADQIAKRYPSDPGCEAADQPDAAPEVRVLLALERAMAKGG